MTTPQPPNLQPVDPLVALSHSVRDVGDARRRHLHALYAVILAALAVVVGYGSLIAYQAHERELAVLETKADTLSKQFAQSEKAADVWRGQALALSKMRAVDTIQTVKIVTNTKTYTVPIPVTAPDGTVSEIPMPVVTRASFDSVGAACSRERQDCTQLLTAKDGQIGELTKQVGFKDSLFVDATTQLRVVKRATIWTKIGYGSIGFSAGYTAGSLSCRR